MKNKNDITIICGHYGCGKTNLALNLAIESAQKERNTILVDMDIVNPYFRSSEYRTLLSEKDIKLIAPEFAGTTLDTPTLSAEINSVFVDSGSNVFIDAGGDDVGATALGGFHKVIEDNGYEMIYVINMYRVLSRTAEEAVTLLKEIEKVSRLKATAIVNNSHLGVETTLENILNSLNFAKEISELTKLPLSYSTVPSFAVSDDSELPNGIRIIERNVKFFWE